jgi:Holliday junction resolvase RusA-like endonuclease
MRIVLPWPRKELSPNARVHRMTKARFIRRAREFAHYTTLEQLGPNCKQMAAGLPRPLSMTLTFHAPDAQRRDRDNLLASCKSAIDGMCQALWIDDAEFCRVTAQTGERATGVCVVVEIEGAQP